MNYSCATCTTEITKEESDAYQGKCFTCFRNGNTEELSTIEKLHYAFVEAKKTLDPHH